jgi:hypothetical protein
MPSTKQRTVQASQARFDISAGVRINPINNAATADSTDRMAVLPSPLSSRLRSLQTMPKS